MLYTIIYTHADGTKTTAQAHENAHANANGATVRTYPTTQDNNGDIIAYNVLRGALQIAKKSAEKAAANGGTDTQFRIANELTGANAKAGTDGAEKYGSNYVLDLIARLSADSQDIFSCAYSGILQAIADGAPIDEQYHAGYLSINAHIMAQRAASQKECSTEYIEADGGALVAINTYMARIIKNGERYTPIESGEMDAQTAERLGAAISASMAALTPRQKDIIKCAAVGLSARQTAEKLHIKSVGTVDEHLTRIRQKVLEYFTANASEFLPLINGDKVQGKKANRHSAEYWKEYRARKKAEKQA